MSDDSTGRVSHRARFFLFACAMSAAVCGYADQKDSDSMPAPLAGTNWTVKSIDGNAPQGEALTAEFSAGGRLNGNAGCNTFSGAYFQTGPSVRIGDLMSTRRACEDAGRQQQETRVLDILKGQMTLRRESGGQVSLQGDTGTLVLAPSGTRTIQQDSIISRRASFNCDGTALTVVFAKETADIIWNAGADTLAQQPSESGVRYESERNVLSGKGDKLTWTLSGRTPRHCVAMR